MEHGFVVGTVGGRSGQMWAWERRSPDSGTDLDDAMHVMDDGAANWDDGAEVAQRCAALDAMSECYRCYQMPRLKN